MAAVILVCEDERDLATLVAFHLQREGYEARVAHTGEQALALSRVDPPPDLVLLDLMLPDMPGTEVCLRLRRDPRLARVPVVMVTARTEEIDRVVGFEVGADDYVTKPFSVRELLLRVRAVLRRAQPPDAPAGGVVELGLLRVDIDGHLAWVDRQPVDLTALEFKMLSVFLSQRGRALTREEILEGTWGPSHFVTLRAVDTHLKRLRGKLGAAGEYIETVRGVGYRLRDRRADEVG